MAHKYVRFSVVAARRWRVTLRSARSTTAPTSHVIPYDYGSKVARDTPPPATPRGTRAAAAAPPPDTDPALPRAAAAPAFAAASVGMTLRTPAGSSPPSLTDGTTSGTPCIASAPVSACSSGPTLTTPPNDGPSGSRSRRHHAAPLYPDWVTIPPPGGSQQGRRRRLFGHSTPHGS